MSRPGRSRLAGAIIMHEVGRAGVLFVVVKVVVVVVVAMARDCGRA